MTGERTERTGYSLKIRALHDVAVDLVTCESDREVFERAVEAAAELLEFDQSVIYVREIDRLVPEVVTGSEVVPEDEVPPFDLDQGAIGHAYQTGDSILTEDVQTDEVSEPISPDIGSGLCVPLGEVGVFNAVSDTPGEFDEEDLALGEILAAHVTTAVGRIQSEAEIRRQKRELERKSERLEEFASILSHDLRSPLSVASGWLDLLEADATDEQLTAIGNVERALDRMETLIDDLLVVSREGWTVENPRTVDGQRLVADAWAGGATDDATLDCEWSGTVRGDPDLLVQAFENLFRNAVDHAGPSVTVRVSPLEDAEGIYVADDGPGIPEDERDDVFEMGVSNDGGTGLGLAIVERVVSAHGWSVSAGESEHGGAQFEMRFDGGTPEGNS
ncbi:histidine kinase [Halobacteriales archaeon SW_10_68_16]|nr:MAG: histidine kinase [Halobacteriales archaeon SW_10_68_16]